MERDEQEILDRFRHWRSLQDDVLIEIERAVIGADFGANGYTTRDQADQIGRLVDLGPGRHLLDLGAGTGWPSNYLAVTTGCTAVAADVPFEGLERGVARAGGPDIDGRVRFVGARAQDLPFRPESFDALVHTDVLC